MRDQILDRHPGPIAIVSGEGTHGSAETYDGKRTLRAIRARLTREESGGDRWARAVVYAGVNLDGEVVGIDIQTGEGCDWPESLPRGVGRPVGSGVGPDGLSLRVQVRIPTRLLARLDAAARRKGVGRSSLLVSAIRAWLGETD